MKRNGLVDGSIILLGLFLVFFLLQRFQAIMRPLALAIIIMFLLLPLTRLSKEKKILLGVITIAIGLALFILVSILGTLIVEEVVAAAEFLPESTTKINESVINVLQWTEIEVGDKIIDLTTIIKPARIAEIAASTVGSVLKAILSLVTELFTALLFLLFLLPSYAVLQGKIKLQMKGKKRTDVLNTLDNIEKHVRSYLSSKTFISLLTAVLSIIVMIIFQVNFVIIFGFLIFVLNFIPNIGSTIAVIAVLISHSLIAGMNSGFIWLALFLIAIQMIVGNVLEPKMVGDRFKISPIVILLSLFFWGSLWGIGGMFMAVPLTCVIKMIIEKIDDYSHIAKYME